MSNPSSHTPGDAMCQQEVAFWVIHFDDAELFPEIFTEEAPARARFLQALDNWNCHLFGPSAEIDRLRASNAALLKALKAVEWIKAETGECSWCPSCRRWQGYSHSDNCSIAAAILKAEGLGQ